MKLFAGLVLQTIDAVTLLLDINRAMLLSHYIVVNGRMMVKAAQV